MRSPSRRCRLRLASLHHSKVAKTEMSIAVISYGYDAASGHEYLLPKTTTMMPKGNSLLPGDKMLDLLAMFWGPVFVEV